MSGEKRRTVLIFAHECAPYNRPESTIGAQRPAQFAKWLPEFGWRAIVICCDAALRRSIPRGGLEGFRRRVANEVDCAEGDDSLCFATPSLTSNGRLDFVLTSVTRNGAGRGATRWLQRGLSLLLWTDGDYSRSWQPCASLAAEEVQRRFRVDAVVGEHGPDAGLHLARWFSRRHRVPWVADFRDPILMAFDGMTGRLYRRVARRWLASAVATVNVTPGWSRLDRKILGRPSFTIRNGFDSDDFLGSMPPRAPGPLRIVYTGQVWRPFQRLETFLTGLRLFRSAHGGLSDGIRFAYAGPHSHLVIRLAADAGVESVVEASGRVPRPEALRLQRSSDLALVVGLAPDPALDWSTTGFLPGKVFEYLGAGLPILCAPSDHADLHDLLEGAGGVTFADTPGDVSRALVGFAETASRSPSGGLPRVQGDVRPYTRRDGARRLATLLDAVVAKRDLEAMAVTGDALGEC